MIEEPELTGLSPESFCLHPTESGLYIGSQNLQLGNDDGGQMVGPCADPD